MGTNGSFDIFPVVDLIAFENRDVKKNVGAIHVSGRLSLMQRKVSNVLLMNAYEEMNEKEIHRIPVRCDGRIDPSGVLSNGKSRVVCPAGCQSDLLAAPLRQNAVFRLRQGAPRPSFCRRI